MGAAQAEGGIVLLPPPGGEARLAAVEACLRAHPAVAAAALLRPVAPQAGAPDAGARITAIVVPRRDALPGAALAAELRGFLRAHVPGPPCPPRIGFARDLPGRTSGLPLDAMLEATRGLGPGPGRQPAR
jgi:acyl-coenzyme A synthetase/AMP-(fatty) acid ligase